MKSVAALAFLLFASVVYGAITDPRAGSIVKDVSDGFYNSAIAITFQLDSEDRDDLIREAIDALIENNERNLFNYGYRLKNTSLGRDIYADTFPIQVQRVLSGQRVKIVNRQDRLPLKLANKTDSAGDRTAYGDSSDAASTTIAWEFNSVFENGKLTFNIFNIEYNKYLKLGVQVDRYGDHTAYGADTITSDRFQWFLVPVNYNNKILFYIVNNKFEQALKESRSAESNGDRKVFGNDGTYLGSPNRLGWSINEYQT